MVEFIQPRVYHRCIPFLSTLYMAIMTCSTVLGNKLILTAFGVISAASLVSPLWYILGDILTEVYGYKLSRKLFWSVIVCQFMLALACYYLIRLHSPQYWHGDEGYQLVLGDLLKFSIINFFAITIAWHVNVGLLVKWKILMHGKYFWLRSIGSSGIGLIIYSVLSVSVNAYNIASYNDVISIVFASCLLKILYLFVLAYPATIVVGLLYKLEGDHLCLSSGGPILGENIKV
jgi:uncharacterized PurR-regulated membrane protein YhhQ (DUF165 family)